jgi:glycerol-3-phosphate dehydrogenase
METLGHHFGGPLYAVEVEYLINHEWARSAADILWRRSKKGLHTPKDCEQTLQLWIDEKFDFSVDGTPQIRVS